jgi:ATPase subunit of ABC transporter with duplicated ATPase domains
MRTTLTPLVIALALALSACGESDDQQSPASSSGGDAQALQERVEKLESEASKRDAEAARKLKAAERKARAAERKARKSKRDARRRRAKARETAAQAEAETVAVDQGGGGIVVPDVTGMDHQAAQDVMQGEGLWLLDEVDCTGQDRMLLWDRNWEVVSTDPPAGTHVSEDDSITLCSKKQGE